MPTIMPVQRRQLKITKLFKQKAAPKKVVDDFEDLREEERQLKEKVKEKQTELFQLQRECLRLRRKPLAPKKKNGTFLLPQRIILDSSIESVNRNIEVLSLLTGEVVQSFVTGGHCTVVFHMQHLSEHAISHGLRIDMQSGRNEILSMAFPVGFNLIGVLEDFDNVMKPECLNAIWKALYAYYVRLQQYHDLQKLVNIEAELFKALDGSYIQISVNLSEDDEDELIPVTIKLDYRLYDIRPKSLSVNDADLPEGMADSLKEQCAVFKKKPLHRAFEEAFMGELAQYKLVQQWGCQPRPVAATRRKKRTRPHNPHNDDTFRPEDCSDQGEDEEGPQ